MVNTNLGQIIPGHDAVNLGFGHFGPYHFGAFGLFEKKTLWPLRKEASVTNTFKYKTALAERLTV